MAAATSVDAAPRGGFFAPGTAPRAPEIMLYFSHAVGAGAGSGSMRPTFGLRVQQIQQSNNTGDPDQGDPMRHRELINWQMEGRSNLHMSNMRVKLGNKLTYDLSNQRFGSPSKSAIQLGTPTMRNGAPSAIPARTFAARSPGGNMGPGSFGSGNFVRNFSQPNFSPPRDPNRDNSNFREIAVAAMAAIVPSRLSAVPQRQAAAQRQGGLASVGAAQRIQMASAR